MTDNEFAIFAAELEATFRGGLEDDRERAISEHIGLVPYEAARACIKRLVMAGQVFVPTPGELVSALRGVTGGGWDFACAINGQSSEERHAQLEAAFARRHPLELEEGDG